MMNDEQLTAKNFSEVLVTATYSGMAQIRALFKRKTLKDENRIKELINAGEFSDYQKRVIKLSELLLAPPQNLPGFVSKTKEADAAEGRVEFYNSFMDAEEEYESLIMHLDTLYEGKLLPEEFFLKQ